MSRRRASRIISFSLAPAAVALAAGLLFLLGSQGNTMAATPVYSDGAGVCAALTPCFTTIQEAVNNAGPAPAEVFVFPGAYAESVDLSLMGSDIAGAAGDITLQTVDASGTPATGTATISPATAEAIRASVPPFPGSVTIAGFTVSSPDTSGVDFQASGDISFAGLTANATLDDGVEVESTGGNVSVVDSIANDNADNGFQIDAGGDITVTGSTTNGSDDEGMDLDAAGDVTVTDSVANGTLDDDGLEIFATNATVVGVTTNENADEGMQIVASADLVVDGVTAIGNGQDGIDVEAASGNGVSVANVTVRNSITQDNGEDGIEFLELGDTLIGAGLAEGNIICGNLAGIELNTDASIDGEGDWWGAGSGPSHPGNASGTGDDVLDSANGASGTVDFDPWVDTITGTGVSATVAVATTVTFEFTGGNGAVSFAEGPGDPNGAPTFTATTDNGTVSTSGFVSGGALEVTLTPATVGTATVTVTGPCGLDDTLGGNSVTLDVAAAPVPTPGATPTATPSGLPETGGAPASGGDSLALAIALVATALFGGSMIFVWRRRRPSRP